MIALWISLGFVGGIAAVIALAWFTRDIFPTVFTPSDWE